MSVLFSDQVIVNTSLDICLNQLDYKNYVLQMVQSKKHLKQLSSLFHLAIAQQIGRG